MPVYVFQICVLIGVQPGIVKIFVVKFFSKRSAVYTKTFKPKCLADCAAIVVYLC